MVCSMTRGPAKPISAPGSAMFRSPSIAKLAVTPPVVGSVITEMYGTLASSSLASAAETLASCIRLMVPSIMRAPPEHETTTKGWRVSSANSMPRVTFSPTTAPIEQHIQPLLGAHFEMKLTLGADQQISFQVLAKHDRAARLALDPQPFRPHPAFFRRCRLIDGFFVALEPGHFLKFRR